jgi:hypothetical protein
VLFFIRIKRQNERKINARTHTHTQRTFFFYFPNKSKKKKKKENLLAQNGTHETNVIALLLLVQTNRHAKPTIHARQTFL